MEQCAKFYHGNVSQQYSVRLQPVSRGAVARGRRYSRGRLAIPGYIHGRSCSRYDYDPCVLSNTDSHLRPQVFGDQKLVLMRSI